MKQDLGISHLGHRNRILEALEAMWRGEPKEHDLADWRQGRLNLPPDHQSVPQNIYGATHCWYVIVFCHKLCHYIPVTYRPPVYCSGGSRWHECIPVLDQSPHAAPLQSKHLPPALVIRGSLLAQKRMSIRQAQSISQNRKTRRTWQRQQS